MTDEQRARVRQGIATAQTGWRQTWREMLWFFGALDEKGDPSATMFFAVAVGIATIHHMWKDPEPSGWDVALVGVIAAVMFGRHTFEKWLSAKYPGSASSRQSSVLPEVHEGD